MSLNFQKSKILGTGITEGTVTQLNRRKEIVSKRVERTPDEVLYLSSNVSWVRVTSSVDVTDDDGPKNAKKYQLFKGISSADRGFVPVEDPERTSYTESKEYGYVPIAGITNFEVQTLNDLGTLRLANITFVVNSPDDFSKLEKLYLRPGFTLLIEWGHSVKVNNDGTIDSDISYYDLEGFSNPIAPKYIKETILSLRKKNSYNYDGMFGTIRNFSWQYNGSNYICSAEVVSNGEVIESILNNNSPILNLKDLFEDTAYDSRAFGTDAEKILSIIKTEGVETFFDTNNPKNSNKAITEGIINSLKNKIPEFEPAYRDLRVIAGNLAGNGISRESYFTKYIRLRDFLRIINFGSLRYDKDGNNLLEFYAGDETYPFTTFSGHIGLDPGVCVLPKKGRDENYNIPFAQQVSDLEETDLLNIFISVDHILDSYKKYSESKKPEDNNVFDLVESILDDIKNNLGGINDFSVYYDEDQDIIYILDLTVTPSNRDFELGGNGTPKAYLDLIGLKSEVENIQVQSAITPEISDMVSIAASNSSSPSALLEVLSMQRWNKGLVNRHIPEVLDKGVDAEVSDRKAEENKQKQKYKEFLDDCSKGNLYYLVYDRDKFTGYKTIHRKITREALVKLSEAQDTNPPGLIPLTLSFTIKGVSGLKPLQVFKVNEFFLPESYKKRVAFIIKGLDHKVENGRWVTVIQSYFKVL